MKTTILLCTLLHICACDTPAHTGLSSSRELLSNASERQASACNLYGLSQALECVPDVSLTCTGGVLCVSFGGFSGASEDESHKIVYCLFLKFENQVFDLYSCVDKLAVAPVIAGTLRTGEKICLAESEMTLFNNCMAMHMGRNAREPVLRR